MMAGITHIGGIDVGGGFAAGNHTVVAGNTSADYLAVVHLVGRNRRPNIGAVVAGFTEVARVNMVSGFAAGINSIVTTSTGLADDRAMIESGRNGGNLRRGGAIAGGVTGHHDKKVFNTIG